MRRSTTFLAQRSAARRKCVWTLAPLCVLTHAGEAELVSKMQARDGGCLVTRARFKDCDVVPIVYKHDREVRRGAQVSTDQQRYLDAIGFHPTQFVSPSLYVTLNKRLTAAYYHGRFAIMPTVRSMQQRNLLTHRVRPSLSSTLSTPSLSMRTTTLSRCGSKSGEATSCRCPVRSCSSTNSRLVICARPAPRPSAWRTAAG